MASVGESNTRCSARVSSTAPEVGAEVAAGLGHGLDDEVADLAGQLGELGVAQRPQVRRLTDLVQRHGAVDATARGYRPVLRAAETAWPDAAELVWTL